MVNVARHMGASLFAAAFLLVRGLVAQEIPDTAPATDDGAIPARAAVGPGPFFVGQEVLVQVTAVGGSERPEIDAPTVAGASLAPAGGAIRPLTASAIGDLTLNESNAFISAFRLVPERPGTLAIPPFGVRLGSRRGATRPLRVEVLAPPAAGRPANFAGGVGPIEASAEVRPEAVRVGQPFEYRVRLIGPGARGTARLPGDVVARLDGLSIRPEVGPLPPESSEGPPSRTFRYRVRPRVAGEVALPPVLLAWFDPTTRRYQSIATGSPRVRVVEVAPMDPTRVAYDAPEAPARGSAARLGDRLRRWSTTRLFWATWWLPIAVGLLGWAYAQRQRRRVAIRTTLRAARRVTAMADQGAGAADLARFLLETLARHLQLARGRPEGVLTSAEAEPAYHEATGDGDLARRVAKLVRRCERVLYAAEPAREPTRELATEAQGLLREIAARTFPEDRPDSSPTGATRDDPSSTL